MPAVTGGTKCCKDCLQVLPLSEFHRNQKTRDGHTIYCKRCASERARRWKENHADADAAYEDARRSKRPIRFALRPKQVDQLFVLEKYDGVCGICGGDVNPMDFDIDHIVPVSLGGTDDYGNLQPAHPRCNRIKGQRILEEVAV